MEGVLVPAILRMGPHASQCLALKSFMPSWPLIDTVWYFAATDTQQLAARAGAARGDDGAFQAVQGGAGRGRHAQIPAAAA